MHVEATMALEPALDLLMFVRGVVVDDEMEIEILWRLIIDQAQKLDPFLVSMSFHTSSNNFAMAESDCSEQSGCPVPLVVMGHRAAPTFDDGQAWLSSVECLNGRLFIQAENQCVVGRIEIKTNDIPEFFFEVRVVAEFECLDKVGL